MRGVKAKRLRRQAYGKGMPRIHNYLDVAANKFFDWGAGVNRIERGCIRRNGTLIIQSARRMYQLLKHGINPPVVNV